MVSRAKYQGQKKSFQKSLSLPYFITSSVYLVLPPI
jgi:hypothetical protein